MATFNITAEGNLLKVDLVINEGDFEPRGIVFFEPSIDMVKNKIKFFESGLYKTTLFFNQIGTVGGASVSSIEDAYSKINTLISALAPAT